MRALLLMVPVLLAGCLGYQPMYTAEHIDFDAVRVGQIQVFTNRNEAGSRRVAQHVSQKLRDLFISEEGRYIVSVDIDEMKEALAIRRDATEERLELVLNGTLMIHDLDGTSLLRTAVRSAAPYSVEATPVATESGRVRARLAAAETMVAQIIHRVTLFLNDQNPS